MCVCVYVPVRCAWVGQTCNDIRLSFLAPLPSRFTRGQSWFCQAALTFSSYARPQSCWGQTTGIRLFGLLAGAPWSKWVRQFTVLRYAITRAFIKNQDLLRLLMPEEWDCCRLFACLQSAPLPQRNPRPSTNFNILLDLVYSCAVKYYRQKKKWKCAQHMQIHTYIMLPSRG